MAQRLLLFVLIVRQTRLRPWYWISDGPNISPLMTDDMWNNILLGTPRFSDTKLWKYYFVHNITQILYPGNDLGSPQQGASKSFCATLRLWLLQSEWFSGRKVKQWETSTGGSFRLLPQYFSDGVPKEERTRSSQQIKRFLFLISYRLIQATDFAGEVVKWIRNWKGFLGKRSWLNRETPKCLWRDWGKPRKTSISP